MREKIRAEDVFMQFEFSMVRSGYDQSTADDTIASKAIGSLTDYV
jgi:hypothetical protein